MGIGIAIAKKYEEKGGDTYGMSHLLYIQKTDFVKEQESQKGQLNMNRIVMVLLTFYHPGDEADNLFKKKSMFDFVSNHFCFEEEIKVKQEEIKAKQEKLKAKQTSGKVEHKAAAENEKTENEIKSGIIEKQLEDFEGISRFGLSSCGQKLILNGMSAEFYSSIKEQVLAKKYKIPMAMPPQSYYDFLWNCYLSKQTETIKYLRLTKLKD